MSQIHWAKVKGGKKKDSFVCSTNTHCGRHSARQRWHRAAGRCSCCFQLACCPLQERGRGVLWFWVSLIACNFLWPKERCRILLLCLSVLLLCDVFACLPLLHISGISFEKAHVRSLQLGSCQHPSTGHCQSMLGFSEMFPFLFLMHMASCYTGMQEFQTSHWKHAHSD